MLKYFFGWRWVGGKIIPRIRLTSAKVLGEVEAELGNIFKVEAIVQLGLGLS